MRTVSFTRFRFVLLLNFLVLTACMPSQYAYLAETPEKVEQWLQECEGNNNDLPRKKRFCDLAIQSQNTSDSDYLFAVQTRGNIFYRQGDFEAAIQDYTEAIRFGADGDAYGNRAYAYEELGDYARARNDYLKANALTDDREYLRELEAMEAELRDAEQARRRFSINFVGFSCPRVQKDSIAYPANEIIIQTVVSDGSGDAVVFDLPGNKRHYDGVKRGHRFHSRPIPVYQGGPGPVTLSVVMWEYDDGGQAIDFSIFLATAAASARGGKAGTSTIYGGKKIPAPRNISGGGSEKSVDRSVVGAIKSVFGTNNDHVGTHHITGIDLAAYTEAKTQNQSGFQYHLQTRHRRGGADCRVYFQFQEI